jgi:hypothetical protein
MTRMITNIDIAILESAGRLERRFFPPDWF